MNKESIKQQKEYIDSRTFEEQESNTEIATANKKISNWEAEVNNYHEFIDKPYIAHLQLVSDNNDTLDLYLTERHEPPIDILNDDSMVVSLSGEGELVLQIATNYYNNSLEKITCNGITYEYDLFRSIIINNSVLEKVFPLLQIKGEDEHYSEKLKEITDMFLLEILNSRRSEKSMPSIIASIQKHQYAIISEPEKSNYIVNGCAGSGKTAIMIHRLHFLKARKKNIDWNKTTIISPSKLFEEYSYKLMKEFNLDKIKQMSIEEYYWSILLEYDSYFKDKDKNIVTYKDFEEQFIERFFSNECLEQIKSEVNSFLSSIFDDSNKYCNINVKGRTIKEKIDLLFEWTESYLSGWKVYNDKLKESPELQILKKDYEYFEREIRKQDKQINSISTELSEQWKQFSESKEPIEKGKIQKKIENLMQKINRIQKESEENQILFNEAKDEFVTLTNNKIENAEEYSKKGNIKNIKRINSDLKNIERSIFSHVLKTCINPIKQEADVDSYDSFNEMKTISKVELWALVYIYYTINGKGESTDNSILCIDEGQNINTDEYMLISKIKDSATINIYGDLKQRLFKNVGIPEWEILSGFKVFEMNQNYRNPRSIVQYCNSKLGLDMQELGIVGERVTEINSKEFIPTDMSRIIDDIYNINNGDIIIVAKNKGSFDKLKEMYDGNNTLRYSDSSYKEIYQGEISVLPLGTVIGMEFPNVIVYSYSMTASQRYIAYTRATKELVVIE